MSDALPLMVLATVVLTVALVCFAGWLIPTRRSRQGRSLRHRRSWIRWLPPGMVVVLAGALAYAWTLNGTLPLGFARRFDPAPATPPTRNESPQVAPDETRRNTETDRDRFNELATQLAAIEVTQRDDRQRLTGYESLTNELRADLHQARELNRVLQKRLEDVTEQLDLSQAAHRAAIADAETSERNHSAKIDQYIQLAESLRGDVAQARKIAESAREQLSNEMKLREKANAAAAPRPSFANHATSRPNTGVQASMTPISPPTPTPAPTGWVSAAPQPTYSSTQPTYSSTLAAPMVGPTSVVPTGVVQSNLIQPGLIQPSVVQPGIIQSSPLLLPNTLPVNSSIMAPIGYPPIAPPPSYLWP